MQMENDIPKSKILDIDIVDKHAKEIFDSEIKLAHMGRLKLIKNKCKMIKKLVKQKRL